MRLGISYILFDGEELLEPVIQTIRQQVDFISVIYQTTSYFGKAANSSLEETIKKSAHLIDKIILAQPDLSLHFKQNELNFRNLGLEESRKAGCTHHISADVDEFYKPEQLAFAKQEMVKDYDSSLVCFINYYKNPSYMISPDQGHVGSFIHPVENSYEMNEKFPARIEITRRLNQFKNIKVFDREEFVVHHMTYVRKDIRKKLENNSNGVWHTDIDKFVDEFSKYQLGDRLRIAPDFMNRKTILVENTFGIYLE